jgi:hypothetical protein
MVVQPPAFARRHAQRQALRSRNKPSFGDLQSQEHCRRYKQIRNQRVNSDKDSDSGSDTNNNIDLDGDDSNTDTEAQCLNELVEKFREMGLQISNLGPVALKKIQTEKNMW